MSKQTKAGQIEDAAPVKFGYFSVKALEVCKTVFWKTPSGNEVEVTCVGTHANPRESGYVWDDAVCVGQVTAWSRDGYRRSQKVWQ